MEQDHRPHTNDRPAGTRAAVAAAAIVFLLYTLLATPLGLNPDLRGQGAGDEANYHLPAIKQFADQLPRPDLRDYPSATTPGYHLAAAAVLRATGHRLWILRALNAAITGALLAILFHACTAATMRRGRSAVTGLACAAPVLCSMYVFWRGVYLTPDNTAWLLVLTIIILALRARNAAPWLAAVGAALLALVLVRQIHIWAAAPIWAAAWLAAAPLAQHENEPGRASLDPSTLFSQFNRRTRAALLALAATIPAIAALALFAHHWGGLIPPRFRDELWHTGVNPATPAFILALFGGFGIFFFAWTLPALAQLWRYRRAELALAAAAAFLVSALPATSYDPQAGRWSGLWNIADRLPTILDRSPLIVVLGTLGGVWLLCLLRALCARDRWTFTASIVAFTCAQTTTISLWQRYHEPFVLMLLALMTTRQNNTTATRTRPLAATTARAAGPALLACVLAAAAAATALSPAPSAAKPNDRNAATQSQENQTHAAHRGIDP